jgi:hypothetical protein
VTPPCARCGAPVTRDGFRTRCDACRLSPAFCRCQPVAVAEPAWRRWTREHGNAKELAA